MELEVAMLDMLPFEEAGLAPCRPVTCNVSCVARCTGDGTTRPTKTGA